MLNHSALSGVTEPATGWKGLGESQEGFFCAEHFHVPVAAVTG